MINFNRNKQHYEQSLLRCSKLNKKIARSILDLYEKDLYVKGQSILSEGNKPLGVYYILSGKVKINKHGVDNKEQIIRILGSGDYLGYKDLLIDSRYSISADSFEECEIVFIPKEEFLQVMNDDNEVASYFNKLLCHDLMYTEQRLVDMVQKPVRERVADALLELEHQDEGNDLHEPSIMMTRNDLANLVGSVKETVIRILSEFKSDHLISTNGSKIDILNSGGLYKITHMYH